MDLFGAALMLQALSQAPVSETSQACASFYLL